MAEEFKKMQGLIDEITAGQGIADRIQAGLDETKRQAADRARTLEQEILDQPLPETARTEAERAQARKLALGAALRDDTPYQDVLKAQRGCQAEAAKAQAALDALKREWRMRNLKVEGRNALLVAHAAFAKGKE